MAKPPFLKVFLDTYKVNPNSELGKAKCLTCHMSPAPPKRNPYGLAVQAAMESAHSRMLTPEILKSIEKKDSDGDGVSNLAEIKAGTLPGSKESKPGPKKPEKKDKRRIKSKKAQKTAQLEVSPYDGFALACIPTSILGIGLRSSRKRRS